MSEPKSLAKVFSRHTYGMLSWVDLFGSKLKYITNLEMKLTVTKIVADNAKHAKLFSDRAKELGQNPESYKPPDIGQKIYDILETYDNPFDDYAYAWGSLVHFSDLLNLYINVADPKSRQILHEVKKDVEGHLLILEQYFKLEANSELKKKRVEEIKAIADRIYTDREDEEINWYAL
ncbi:MAG: hypothetical protein ACR2NW_07210 [Thermodesulfobacteriota bacterium]